MNERQQKLEAIVALAELRGKELTDAATRLWLAALDDLSADAVCLAVAKATRTGGPHMESPKDIRELAGELSPETRALVAWDVACEAIRSVGGYRSIAFADPCITATIRSMGGWSQFCWSDEDDKWLRHRFLKTYEALTQRAIGDDECQVLSGEFDRTNVILGHRSKPPVMFGGDQKKALPLATALPMVDFRKP